MDGFVLEEKSSFEIPRLCFSSKLHWGTWIVFFAKTTSKKIGALTHSMKILSSEVALYLYFKFTMRPFRAGAPSDYLEMFDNLQKWICRTVGPSLAASFNPWLIIKIESPKVFSIHITLVDVHTNWLNWFHFLILEGGLLIILIRMYMSTVSFFPYSRLLCLYNTFL